MTKLEILQKELIDCFGEKIEMLELAFGDLTLQISKEALHPICKTLRDDPRFDFKMLIDVCGVDYLHYGIDEWQTKSSTETGFSRGVEIDALLNPPESPTFEEGNEATLAPEIQDPLEDLALQNRETDKKFNPIERFATVYHLLSLNLNHRLRLRVLLDSHTPTVDSVFDLWPSANWFEREAFDLFGIHFKNHPDLRRLLTDYGFIGHPFRKDFPLIGNVEARYDAKLKRVVYEAVSIKPRILEPKVIRHDNRYEVQG